MSSTSCAACQKKRYGLIVVPRIRHHHLPIITVARQRRRQEMALATSVPGNVHDDSVATYENSD